MVDFKKLLKNHVGARPQEVSMPKTAAKPQQKKGSQFDDSNRGVLFVNDKDGNDSRPDFTGNLAIKPEDYESGDDGLIRIRLAAWKKESDKVGEYLSIAASAPQQS
jgi:hypothetical protein